jgi:1-aminocyclopropane-1-carboxylate deaminase/D-cysteine desulfhydrase-like pyridoxal-dependent ACC family enzyme
VYYACGSGGTGAGLALGMAASSLQGELVGLCVDDTPQEYATAPVLPAQILWTCNAFRGIVVC